MSQLRICIDARFVSGTLGGVEQVVIGLASGLSNLTDSDEEYLFLAIDGADDWIKPHVKGPCRILYGAGATLLPKPLRWLRRLPYPRRMRAKISQSVNHISRSDGMIEKVEADVMHFTSQRGFLTAIPSIYHPHDLQHLHLPQFFAQTEIEAREFLYRTLCGQASMVAVTSSWGKQDIIKQYGLCEDKVRVIPWAPALMAYPSPADDDLKVTKQKFALPDKFIFYPAQTWAHKNHIGLLKALAILRERYDLVVPFVSSGRITDFYSEIQQTVDELHLTEQVKFLGFVSPLELHCLYKLSRAIVIPSKFEAASFPLWEAFLAGIPAACSNVTSLPMQAADAALVFDPDSPENMAESIYRLYTDESLRQTLISRGRQNVSRFTWDMTARMFRAHYRKIANRNLTPEDQQLLNASPIL
jgi:glycosyltransferase involved in cell wall biosynthesis